MYQFNRQTFELFRNNLTQIYNYKSHSYMVCEMYIIMKIEPELSSDGVSESKIKLERNITLIVGLDSGIIATY